MMFAHQVIEAKEKSFSQELLVDPIKKIAFKNPDIRGAMCFHMGDYDDCMSLCKLKINEPLPLDENAKYIKAPYRRIWIDCYRKKQKTVGTESDELSFCDKYGILVIDMGHNKIVDREEVYYKNTYAIFSYFHYKRFNHWLMCPIIIFIEVHGDKVGLKMAGVQIDGYYPMNEEFMEKIINQSCGDILAIVLFTMKLLNCKNIETVNNYPPKKLNEARRRKGKQELLTYKTLQIKLPGNKQERGESQPTGDHNRIHLCRGHFKEYTEEHPLFGKITGLWWWQPHVRGQNREGIVLKDYQIKTTGQELRV